MSLGSQSGPAGVGVKVVGAKGSIRALIDALSGKASSDLEPIPRDFAGTLRPYQHRGYSWMHFLCSWGLGACLADDMGLGKTCTTLALVCRRWDAGDKRPTLIVCPTSVVANWQKESQRFTPSLPVHVHHGAERIKDEAFKDVALKHAVVLSSYSLLHRDAELLKTIPWAGLILDEAQNIKNPETKQARAARGMSADFRIALTGTPVENHIGDLWSLMEFLNPGFAGSQAQFRRNYFVPIQFENDAEAADRLKRLTGPFILRRMKTDRSIITDLPDKIESNVYCHLTKEQATLYRAVTADLESALASSEGIQRSGIVLSTLSKIKQICNHPAQFLGDNSSISNRSGKLARLTEMLEEVLDTPDRALIFTQFAEMGNILKRYLQETFGEEVLFLHGAVPKKQRDAMVEKFQQVAGPRVFILSLKAGGTGLNLTQANHVFHFDRWWNPAVENQATDRAFRIGQVKSVQVHKFVCTGTLEERIDSMIENKKAVAGKVVGTGEDWLTKLSDTDLKSMFRLSADAAGD
jgi:SNF2 family DNA or RNA helicase